MTEEEELELLQLRKRKALVSADEKTWPFRGKGASGDWGFPDQGPLDAIATKFHEGLTKKGSDELVGIAGRLRTGGARGQYLRLPDGSEVSAQTPEETQLAFREAERQKQGAASQHWPKLGFVADTAGEVASDVALAGSKMVRPAYQALVGVGRGILGSNSDDLADKAVAGTVGGTLGYLLGKSPEIAKAASQTRLARAIAESRAGQVTGDALMSAVRWPGEALRGVAARRATSAAGLIQKDLNKLPPEAADTIGQELLDRGLIKPGRTAEELRPGIVEARREAGREIGAFHSAADAVSGGTGPQVRRAVSARRLEDANLREAEREAEAMFTDAAQTGVAEDVARRRAQEAATKNHLLSESLIVGKNKDALAAEVAGSRVASEFGERGTTEAFKRAGELPLDVKMGRIPAADPASFTKGLGFDAGSFIEGVEGRLMPELEDPVLAPLKKQMTTLLAGYRAKAARGISHTEANAWKSNVQKTIAKFQDAPVSQEAKIRLQGILDDEIERSMGEKLGQPVIPEYRAAKSAFGALREAEKGSAAAIKRDAGNYKYGLMEALATVAGGTAGAAHGSAGALAGMAGLGLGAHLLKHRGASTAAWAANGASKALLGIVENAPHLLGEFGAVIAGQKTPEARLAMAEELAQRYPEFAEMLDGFKQRPGPRSESSQPEARAR